MTFLKETLVFIHLLIIYLPLIALEGKAEIAQEILQTIDALPSFTNGVMADPDFRGPAEFSDKDHMPTYFSGISYPLTHTHIFASI